MRIVTLAAAVALLAACDPKSGSTGTTTTTPAAGAPASTAPSSVDVPKGELTYYFGVRETHTKITFQSKNDLTDILGESRHVVGNATINFEAGTGTCELTVPTITLNSGMADRDRAMMNATWLNEKQFPNIQFKGMKATLVEKPNVWKVDGKFVLRGVEKDLSVQAKVRPLSAAVGQKLGFGDGPCLKVETAFKVKLADYGIEIPSTAVATVQPEISVAIDIWGSTVKPKDVEIKRPADAELPTRVTRLRVSEDGLEGTKYQFGKKPQFTMMTAVSEAELEKITAQTNTVFGFMGLDKVKGTGKVRLAFPVDTLRTGNALMEEHLRGKDWLDAAQFKAIEFESTKVTKKDDKNWTVEGDFTLHGVKKPITVDVVMRDMPAEVFKKAGWGDIPGVGFAGKFKIKLSDFGVKVPEIAISKVKDEWAVSIDLIAIEKE